MIVCIFEHVQWRRALNGRPAHGQAWLLGIDDLAAAFARLDADCDGFLDPGELARAASGPGFYGRALDAGTAASIDAVRAAHRRRVTGDGDASPSR